MAGKGDTPGGPGRQGGDGADTPVGSCRGISLTASAPVSEEPKHGNRLERLCGCPTAQAPHALGTSYAPSPYRGIPHVVRVRCCGLLAGMRGLGARHRCQLPVGHCPLDHPVSLRLGKLARSSLRKQWSACGPVRPRRPPDGHRAWRLVCRSGVHSYMRCLIAVTPCSAGRRHGTTESPRPDRESAPRTGCVSKARSAGEPAVTAVENAVQADLEAFHVPVQQPALAFMAGSWIPSPMCGS